MHAGADVFQVQQLVKGTDDGFTQVELLLLEFLYSQDKLGQLERRICDRRHGRRRLSISEVEPAQGSLADFTRERLPYAGSRFLLEHSTRENGLVGI